jgi:hypothetical protein
VNSEPVQPLSGDPKRQADALFRGCEYQVWQTANAWLRLGPDELLFVEGAEDFDVVGPNEGVAIQVKNAERPVSLRSSDVQDAIRHYWQLRTVHHGTKIFLRFLTRGTIAQEQGAPFGGNVAGLGLWMRQTITDEECRKLADFLVMLDGITELQAILAVADPEWRSPILFGLYTGQRLSDLVSLSWNNIDLERDEVRLITSKTSRSMIIPMAPPLRVHIESLPAGDNPQAPLHPRAFAILSRTGNASTLSSAFSDLLMQAGLRVKPTPRSHRSRGIGHSGRRRINELSFHSLRRTATTLLHEAGVPPTVAQALIGHDSEEVHSDYITVGREALRSAVNLFPTL